jgi:hypothetical protein
VSKLERDGVPVSEHISSSSRGKREVGSVMSPLAGVRDHLWVDASLLRGFSVEPYVVCPLLQGGDRQRPDKIERGGAAL